MSIFDRDRDRDYSSPEFEFLELGETGDWSGSFQIDHRAVVWAWTDELSEGASTQKMPLNRKTS